MKRRQPSAAKAIEAGMLPKAELKRRGWTESLIKKLLGEPDTIIHNTNGGEIQCFALARVEDAESGDAFQKHVAKFNARQIDRELEPIFAMWAKLTPAARTAFLMRLCGGG